MAEEWKGAQLGAAPAVPAAGPSIGAALRSGASPHDALAALWRRRRKRVSTWVVLLPLGLVILGVMIVLFTALAVVAEDPWDSSTGKAVLFASLAFAGMLAIDRALQGAARWALRIESDGEQSPRRRFADSSGAKLLAIFGIAVGVAFAWITAPVVHGVLILFYIYPLVTWVPPLVCVPLLAGAAAAGSLWGGGARDGVRRGLGWQTCAVLTFWTVAMMALPAFQGHALHAATSYVESATLPDRTQPRLLPKEAAVARGESIALRDSHLVVDPSTDALVYSAEQKAGALPRGRSGGVIVLPVDAVDGAPAKVSGGFRPAVSQVGPGSLTWRAYRRHFFTRVMERVIVPLRGGGAVAVAPYIGFKGFPVRHPFWQGVYVLHQDGRLEDLTPRQALARSDLAASGHLFPEKLARDIAEAYGYGGRAHTVVTDESDDEGVVGNRQPYLTNLGDGRVRWVTVAHAPYEDDRVTAIFLTDSITGRTEVWHAPRGSNVLSNNGAVRLVRKLHLNFSSVSTEHRRATEPRPVFARGRLYYLVSIVPEGRLVGDQPVERTALVDALRHRIVRVFDHADPEADDALRDFFGVSSSRP